MNNFIKILFCVILLLSGCAGNQVMVTYYSNPTGAIFLKGERAVGYTPFTIVYNIQPGTDKERYLDVRGTRVVWASGASCTIDSLALVQGQGANFYFTFVRPNVPGREIDINFASELERNRILVQQSDAQKSQDYWQKYNTVLDQYRQSYVPGYTPNSKSSDCTSTQVGSYIYADCY